ncbi:MAG: TaqI-like C-terminal specificity domain-containing protein [Bacteroidales bacterium]|nr:Eco57I restriction-modification methylase domain-containing protein [Bacteroidales bacterium]
MINSLINDFSNHKLVSFLRAQNNSFVDYEEDLSDNVKSYDKFENLIKLGNIEYGSTDVLMVYTCEYQGELTSRSSRKDQFEIAKKALSEDFKDGAIFVFYDSSGRFRFSFLRHNYGDKTNKFTPWKRYTYFVEPDAKTNRTFIERIGNCKFDSLDSIQQAFSVETLTKDFYKELSNWYFWAIKNVSFPNDVTDDTDNEKYNSENIIRLITRLIFAWFLKQKGLINNELFDTNSLSEVLKEFDPESDTQNNYYRAILQNLFFATLNQEINKRDFAEDKGFVINRATNSIKNLYRYEKEFKINTTEILELFCQIPFLNGGLFECLDRKEKDGEIYDWDGFSRNPKYQAKVPNKLFFAKETKVDLSDVYNDKKLKSVSVAGIIEILSRYNFTVEENTPVEVEVALDPELLGKVFENLLGAYNPETQETARKQTGSFYTPREIVNYMVDESLIAYFHTKVPDIPEETLRLLFSYDEEQIEINDHLRESLIKASLECKILDPACGSGAFPMGILQQMVHVLKKIDPDNSHWNNVVMAQAMEDFEKSDKLSDEDIDELRKEIEKTFDDGLNYLDYARKLHVIENCIYGVDIQSIAVQISKLRFFISLVCEQRKNSDPIENFGIRPLPNLETKFVAANTLIGLDKTEEDLELFNDSQIKTLIDKLQYVRHRQFLVTNSTEKKRLRDKDQKLREDIENEISKLYVKHKDENKALYVRQKMLAEKELELLDKSIERSTVSFNIFGEKITKTYKPNDKRKKELQDTIKVANKKIEEASDYSRLGTVVTLARQLTSWNPYDQNQSSPFFDPEWMFGLQKQNEGYFDVVIGNPPYVKEYTDKSAFDCIRDSKHYQGKMDLWYFFACIGIDFLCYSGHLCFIATNNWVTNAGASKMRNKVISDSAIVQLVDFGNFMIFESASIQTMVMIFERNKHIDNYSFDYRKLSGNTTKSDSIDLLLKFKNPKATYLNPIIKRSDLINTLLTFNNNLDDLILEKISKDSLLFTEKEVANGIHPHYDFVNNKISKKHNIDIGLGIFGLSDFEKNNLDLTSNELELIKPYFSTEQVARYCTFPNHKLWLIYTDSSFKNPKSMKNYPNLKRHLDKYTNVITSDNKPYGLHRAREERFFKGEKIIVQRKCVGRPSFSYADFDTYVSATFYIVKSDSMDHKYLLGLLNSKLIEFWLRKKGKMQGDNFQLDKEPLLNIPIRKPTEKAQISITKYIDEILSILRVSNDSNIKRLEQQIDNLVYRLYELTYEDIKVIDQEIESKISEAEYNAIEI